MSSSDASSPEVPDKNALWGWWRNANAWQETLHRKAAHKALDIPEDMGDIQANRTSYSGLGWKELAVLGGLGLGGLYLWNNGQKEYVTPPAATAPADSEYEVRFFQKQPDGSLKKIDVPRVPTE